jgi:hypothetical protein
VSVPIARSYATLRLVHEQSPSAAPTFEAVSFPMRAACHSGEPCCSVAVVIFTAVSEDLTECLLLSEMPTTRSGRVAAPAPARAPRRNRANGQFVAAASKIAAAFRGSQARKQAASATAAASRIAAAARGRKIRRANAVAMMYAGPSKCGKGRKGMKAGERTNRAGTKQGRPGVRCP